MAEWDELDEEDYQKDLERFDKLVEQYDQDIQGSELQGMEMRANHYLAQGRKSTKSERRLSKDLLKCVRWIQRETYIVEGAYNE